MILWTFLVQKFLQLSLSPAENAPNPKAHVGGWPFRLAPPCSSVSWAPKINPDQQTTAAQLPRWLNNLPAVSLKHYRVHIQHVIITFWLQLQEKYVNSAGISNQNKRKTKDKLWRHLSCGLDAFPHAKVADDPGQDETQDQLPSQAADLLDAAGDV